jgi:hypothetical protein
MVENEIYVILATAVTVTLMHHSCDIGIFPLAYRF